MRRPVSVKSVFLPVGSFRLSRAASVAILPSALFWERWFARCKLGVLISAGADNRPRLPFLFDRSWARTWAQSPELGGSARLFGSHSTPRCLPLHSANLHHSRSPFHCALSASIVGSVSHPAGDRPSHPI